MNNNKITNTLFLMVLVSTLALFFANTMDAQQAGSQAFRLIGTIQSRNFIGAVFSDSKGEQTFSRLHDTLPDGSQITAVRSDSISLKGTDGVSSDMYITHEMITPSVSSAAAAAPVQPEPPVDPSVSGAWQNSHSTKLRTKAKPRARHGKSKSDYESEEE